MMSAANFCPRSAALAPCLQTAQQQTAGNPTVSSPDIVAQQPATNAKAKKRWGVDSDGVPQPKALTHYLTKASSIAEVTRRCYLNQEHLNAIHITAALNRCVSLVERQQQRSVPQKALPAAPQVLWQGQLPHLQSHLQQQTVAEKPQHPQLHKFVSWALDRLLQQQHLCSSREISTALWCCAKLQYIPKQQVLDQLLSRFADLLSGSSSQAISVVLYSLAKLGISPGQTWLDQLLLRLFKLVVSDQLLARSSVTSHPCGVTEQNGAQQQQQQLQQPLQQHMYSKDDDFVQHIQHSGSQQQVQPLFSNLQQQWRRQCSGAGQALSNTIWSLARLEQDAAAEVWLLPLLSLLCAQQQQQQQVNLPGIPLVGMQSVANVLWACGQLFPVRAAARDQQQQFGLGASLLERQWQQDLGISWGTSRLQRSRAQVELTAAVRLKAATLLESCKNQLHTAEPKELVMLIHACMDLELAPSREWQQQFWAVAAAALHYKPGAFEVQECVSMLFGAAYLRLQPSAAWFAALLLTLRPMLATATPEQLSKAVWAIGTLRARPPVDWMTAVVAAFVSQLQQRQEANQQELVIDLQQPQQQDSVLQQQQQDPEQQQQQGNALPVAVSMLFWGASKIGYRMPSPTLDVLLAAVATDLGHYRPHQLSKLLLGCSSLRVELPEPLLASILSTFNQQLQQSTAADVTMMLRALTALQRDHQQQQMEQQQQQQGKQQLGRHLGGWQLQVQQDQGSSNRSRTLDNLRLAMSSNNSSNPGHSSRNYDGPSDQAQLQFSDLQQVDILIQRAEQLLGYMTAVELCQTLYSVAQLGATVNTLAWTQAVNYTLPRQMHLLAPGDLCLLLYSLAKMQHAIHSKRALHKQLLLHSYSMLAAGRFKPVDLAAFVWNYFRLYQGRLAVQQQQWVPPKRWVAGFTQAAGAQLHSLTGKQLGVMLKGLLLTGVVVDRQFLDMAQSMVEFRSASFDKYELAVVSSLLLQLQQVELAARSAEALTPLQQQQGLQQLPKSAPAEPYTQAAPVQPVGQLQNGVVPVRAVGTVPGQLTALGDVAGHSAELDGLSSPRSVLGRAAAGTAQVVSGAGAARERLLAVVARAAAGRQ